MGLMGAGVDCIPSYACTLYLSLVSLMLFYDRRNLNLSRRKLAMALLTAQAGRPIELPAE